MAVFVFVFGLIIGSFLNVCIYRIPKKESIVMDSSHCPFCNSRIKHFDLIPVFSYLILGGKCRNCRTKISVRYPVVELLNAILYMVCFWHYGWVYHIIPKCILCSVLIVISFIDFDTKEIPNGSVLIILICGMINIWLDPGLTWINGLIGFFAASLPMFLIALISGGGMGGGDIKLMAAAGLFLGWSNILTAFFIACLVAGFTGLVLILTKKKGRKDKIPFGPFLAFGILLTMFYGNEMITRYLQFAGIL